jgi:DegV family protein with EDD domain
MKKIVIVTDSIATPPQEAVERYGIQILPINIIFKGRKYRDGLELSAAEANRMLKEKPEQFFSAPATVGEYLEVFRNQAKTAVGILCIVTSSRLSTVYNVANLAKKQAELEGITIPIKVIDSMTVTTALGLIVTAAAEAAEEGKSLDEMISLAEKIKERVRLIGILDSVKNVYRTGRIPRFTSSVGSLLNIKPCFSIIEGAVHLNGLIKNQEDGIQYILRRLKKDLKDSPAHIAIAHCGALESAGRLAETIRGEFDCRELWLTDVSPVIAYATGAGVIIVSYYANSV